MNRKRIESVYSKKKFKKKLESLYHQHDLKQLSLSSLPQIISAFSLINLLVNLTARSNSIFSDSRRKTQVV